MRFSPTPEQQQLGDMVQRFFAEQYRFDARRKILDSREGWSRETWSKLAELGLLSLQVPEEQGGMAPAVVETLLTATATGTAMLLEPWVSSAIIGTVLIRELGSAQQREEMLVPMAAGERIAVPAHFEPAARYDLHRVATSARRGGGGWVLKGRKTVVLHAPAADLLLVSARTSGAADEATGISVFAVPREGPGVALSQYRTLDGVCAADVELADAPGTLIGPDGTPSPHSRPRSIRGSQSAARKRWARCRPPSTRPSSTRRHASNSAFPSPGSRRCSIAWRTCSSMSSRRAR